MPPPTCICGNTSPAGHDDVRCQGMCLLRQGLGIISCLRMSSVESTLGMVWWTGIELILRGSSLLSWPAVWSISDKGGSESRTR